MEVTTLLVLSLELISSLVGWGAGLPFVGEVGVPLPSRLHGLFEIIRGVAQGAPKKDTRRPVNLPIDFNGELTLPHKTLNNSSQGHTVFPILFDWATRSVSDVPMWFWWRCHHSPGCQSTVNWKVTKLELGSRSGGLKGLSPKKFFTQKSSGNPNSAPGEPISMPFAGIMGDGVLDTPYEGCWDQEQDIGPKEPDFPTTRRKKVGNVLWLCHQSDWLTVWHRWVLGGPHTYLESDPWHSLAFRGMTCPSISGQGTFPERCPVKKQQRLHSGPPSSWPLKLTPSWTFQKVARVGTWATPPGRKWVDQELALLQAARGCQSPPWALMANCSCWPNYVTLGCMC